MDTAKLRDLVDTIQIEEDVDFEIKKASDRALATLASRLVLRITTREENPHSALGALIWVGMEAARRAVTPIPD